MELSSPDRGNVPGREAEDFSAVGLGHYGAACEDRPAPRAPAFKGTKPPVGPRSLQPPFAQAQTPLAPRRAGQENVLPSVLPSESHRTSTNPQSLPNKRDYFRVGAYCLGFARVEGETGALLDVGYRCVRNGGQLIQGVNRRGARHLHAKIIDMQAEAPGHMRCLHAPQRNHH